jgi:hypothetical protein
MDNDIILSILPPYLSHLTQLLDVGVFHPLKKYIAKELQLFKISTGCDGKAGTRNQETVGAVLGIEKIHP